MNNSNMTRKEFADNVTNYFNTNRVAALEVTHFGYRWYYVMNADEFKWLAYQAAANNDSLDSLEDCNNITFEEACEVYARDLKCAEYYLLSDENDIQRFTEDYSEELDERIEAEKGE